MNFRASPPFLISLLSCALCSPISDENESWIVDWLTGRWIEMPPGSPTLSDVFFFCFCSWHDFFLFLFVRIKSCTFFSSSLHLNCLASLGYVCIAQMAYCLAILQLRYLLMPWYGSVSTSVSLCIRWTQCPSGPLVLWQCAVMYLIWSHLSLFKGSRDTRS